MTLIPWGTQEAEVGESHKFEASLVSRAPGQPGNTVSENKTNKNPIKQKKTPKSVFVTGRLQVLGWALISSSWLWLFPAAV